MPLTGDLAHNPGMCPETGNRLVHRLALNPLGHTSQGHKVTIYVKVNIKFNALSEHLSKLVYIYYNYVNQY